MYSFQAKVRQAKSKNAAVIVSNITTDIGGEVGSNWNVRKENFPEDVAGKSDFK